MDECLEVSSPNNLASFIHIKQAISECDLDKSYLTNVEFYRRYLNGRERPGVDGYSGGALFSLTGELENLEIVLDGIVVRAGAQQIHIVDADYHVQPRFDWSVMIFKRANTADGRSDAVGHCYSSANCDASPRVGMMDASGPSTSIP